MEVKDSIEVPGGKGLFTTKYHEKGTIVHVLSGRIFDKPTREIIHIGKNKHIHDEYGIFINHSFKPNIRVDDYNLVDEIKGYIRDNNIKNSVFLISASSLSNMIIHKCYEAYPNNTYIDVGSSLNPFIPGIGSRRAYMSQLSTGVPYGGECIW